MWASILIGILGLAYAVTGIWNPSANGKPVFKDRFVPILLGAFLIFVGFGSIR